MMRNLGGMMKKVQEMQGKMESLQAEHEHRLFTASVGANAVSVTLSGKGRITALTISPEACDPEDTETLADLIQLAVNKAQDEADNAKAAALAEITDGLPLPAGMKLPF